MKKKNKEKRHIPVFKIIVFIIIGAILAGLLSLYIYLRLRTPQKDGLFIPPSEKRIVRQLKENYKEMEYVKDYAIKQDSFRWHYWDKNNVEAGGEEINAADVSAELKGSLEGLYNAGFRVILDEYDGISFERWRDFRFYVGLIYTENPTDVEQRMKSDKYLRHVNFKETGIENWYYYNYDYYG